MLVRDVMIPVIGHVEPDASVRDAAEKMRALNLNPMPVIENDRVVGVLTEQSLLNLAQREGLGVGSQRVRDAMSPEVNACLEDEDLSNVLKHVDASHSGRMPVVDHERHLVGFVSVEDLRKQERIAAGEVTAAGDVESISELVHYDDDTVDFMSDESFPASDPIPPPSSLGPEQHRNGEED